MQADVAHVELQSAALLAQTDGQVLTSLPGVAENRAAAFSAFTLPIDRWPDAEHLYSATGLAPARYESSTITKRRGISRQGLADHRDALMSIAWGLSQNSPAFRARDAELEDCARCTRAPRSRATPAGSPTDFSKTNNPSTNSVTLRVGSAGGDGDSTMPLDGAT